MSESVPDAVMTVKEVSEYLKLAESTIYKLAQEGKIPGRKIGGAWRFSSKALEAWLLSSEDTVFAGSAKG
jgi:excisionase family DNA binding protein